MIIYSGNKVDFIEKNSSLPKILSETIKKKLGEDTSDNEFLSWQNSLGFMKSIMNSPSIPDDAGVALEYNIPITNNRIDFIITGLSEDNRSQIIIIELKQWTHVAKTEMDGIVITRYEDSDFDKSVATINKLFATNRIKVCKECLTTRADIEMFKYAKTKDETIRYATEKDGMVACIRIAAKYYGVY